MTCGDKANGIGGGAKPDSLNYFHSHLLGIPPFRSQKGTALSCLIDPWVLQTISLPASEMITNWGSKVFYVR